MPIIETKKTVIVVDENDEESANACFHNSDIKIINGYHFLVDLLAAKSPLNSLSKIRLMCGWSAQLQPQAACAAMAKSLQFERSFVR